MKVLLFCLRTFHNFYASSVNEVKVICTSENIYGVNLHIQFEYRKIRTRKNFVFKHFSRTDKF